jgi:arabinofuranosyltransferase
MTTSTTTIKSNHSRWWLAALIGLAVFALNLAYFSHARSDDAYISFRYAKNFANGYGLVFNPGQPPVEGYSNFLWVVLLGGAAKLGFDIPSAAQVFSVMLAAIAMSELALALQRLNYHGLWITAACVWLGVSGSFAMWALPGLETMLLAALIMLAWLLVEREERSGRGWLSALVFVLIALSRAEGAIFFVAAFAVRWLRQLQNRSDRSRRSDVIWTLAFVIPFGLFLVWRLSTYGYLLPNTYYAKVGGNPLFLLLRGGYYFYSFLSMGGGLLLLILSGAALLYARRTAMLWHSAVWLALYLIGFILAGGDWMPMFRFFVPVLPLLCLLAVMGLEALYAQLGRTRRAAILSVGVSVLMAALFMGASVQAQEITRETRNYSAATQPNGPVTAWLRANSQPGDSIALVDAGILAYETDLNVIDMIGLNDAHIAHLPPHPVNPLARGNGFAKWDTDYVLAQEPTFIEMHISLEQWRNGVRKTDWIGTDELINDPRFLQNYEYVAELPTAGIFVRNTRRQP